MMGYRNSNFKTLFTLWRYNMRDNPVFSSQTDATDSVLSTNKVLRNTYMMLAMTLMVSAITAGLAMWMNLGYGSALIMMLTAIVLIWFVLPRTANSSSGIYVVFAFTALMGAALGPTLNYYLTMANGYSVWPCESTVSATRLGTVVVVEHACG